MYALRPVTRALARASTSAPRLAAPALARGNATIAQAAAAEHAEQDLLRKSQTNQAERTLRRFWKTVGIKQDESGNHTITLDKRNLRTPGGALLTIPGEKAPLALLIANEWENQEKLIKPHALPLTSIAARAIDALSDPLLHEQVRLELLKYLNTDTVYFYEDEPHQLATLQEAHWTPLIAWVEETYGVKIEIFRSVLLNSQPGETREKLAQVIAQFDPIKLAAFERAVMYTKSFIIGLALVERKLDVEAAAQASQVEVASQILRWGEVEDSHDVDFQDVRKQLGSVACALIEA